MSEKPVILAAQLQDFTSEIPAIALLSVLPTKIFQYILLGISALLALLLLGMLCSISAGIPKYSRQKVLKKSFGITDFSKFSVVKMGRPGSKYHCDSGSNCFEIHLPHWKFANEDGSRQNRRVNRVIWEECNLWLHDGHQAYVLTTTNPYELIYLVHTLRDRGIDIAPCSQELEKQDRMEKGKKSLEESLDSIIESVGKDERKFTELCRQRLTLRGYALSDAPKNDYGLNFFFRKNTRPVMVKCQLVPRDYLVGVEEIKGVKAGMENLFAESCLYITTGHISVAAAGFAMSNGIEVASNERLVEIMEENQPIPPDKMFMRWELTNDDLKNLLSEDLLSQIF